MGPSPPAAPILLALVKGTSVCIAPFWVAQRCANGKHRRNHRSPWATGYRPDYSRLQVGIFDRKGRIRHDGGVAATPGMYVMGLQFLRRRKTALIDGAGSDAHDLSDHLLRYLHNGGVVG